ncbi:DNA processing protein DprA [Paraliobacillus quinghaiensis]|uniref:DNA processing protein DprA n=1 Tax=Paraliobacillus quinghaiensis TaxID=470815 RepID=A0A917WQS2_9BACI|nr:DNA-processing protein DprA [Paraliobacillus quinghaiensis]GGM21302.1 DNA processing protein DprA [Paraliobacillus quinghaiensis]
MNTQKLRLIHLHSSTATTRPLIHKLLKQDPTLTHLYELTPNEISLWYHVPSDRATKLHQDLHNNRKIEQIYQYLKTYHIWTIFDKDYPLSLRLIPDPPIVLYGLGNREFLNHNPILSVVGTRNPSSEAKRKMHYILSPLAQQNWLFASGMAVGIDGYAHKIACHYKGKTIAVLGGGLKHIYPKKHQDLFKQLVQEHLVVSEYPPDFLPQRYYFPERNRIISGLGFGTIVIEAKIKSGSLITVDQALEQGREVYAVPGTPWFEQVDGCHKMIQDGAKLVRNTYDLVDEWEQIEGKWCRTLSEIKQKIHQFNL